MGGKFIQLADQFYVSPQISAHDVGAAAALGVTLIVNNRPDGEEPSQPKGADIEAAAKAAGIAYVEIPVGAMGIGATQLDKFDAALAANEGGVLAYCRSGTRSSMLRALALARAGANVDALIAEAAEAGYDLSGQRARLKAI